MTDIVYDCPRCNIFCGTIACDNDCGTCFCDSRDIDFYTLNKKVIIGHHPNCGIDSRKIIKELI